MGSTLQSFDAFMKEDYTSEKVEWLTNGKSPLMAKFNTGKECDGDVWVTPAVVGLPQGMGGTLAHAQAGAQQASGGNIKGIKWQVTTGDYSAAVEIGDKVIKASKRNVGAFFENKQKEIDGLYKAFGATIATYFVGNQGHSVTPGTFTCTTGVCQLADPNDIVNIAVGQILVASANDGTSAGHTLIGAPSLGYVVAVNQNAGTFTVSTTSGGAAGTPTSWTGTMFAFRNGDFGGSGATRIILGLGAWIPTSDPSATAFEGVDRTIATTQLSGVRLTAAEVATLGCADRVKKLVTRMAGRCSDEPPTDIILNPEAWQGLADELEARGNRPLDGQIGVFGFKKLQLACAGTTVDIWADRFVPSTTILALNAEYVELKSLDGIPAVLNGDGLTMLRKSTTNDYEHRLQAYPALTVRAPGYCGRTTAPAV